MALRHHEHPLDARKSQRRFAASLLAWIVSCAACARAVAADTVDVVEFHHASQDHYFVTAAPQEIFDLDAGVHPGWKRTGLAFAASRAMSSGASPVCRFYLPPALGDSHFYSASAGECVETQTRFPAFVYESPEVFRVALPDAATGACPIATVPVYRLWNSRRDTNHRYTTDASVRQHMVDLGWVPEGYGSNAIAMCASPSPHTIEVAVTGRSVLKARSAGDVVGVLEERPTSIFEDGPDRVLVVMEAGIGAQRTYAAPSGWSLVDFAVHPSSDVSIVLTTATSVRIVRLDRQGLVREDQTLVDPRAVSDPYLEYIPTAKADDSLQPVLMHDAARVVALGESVALVLRTGRNAVVAYRLDPDSFGAYRLAWRTLVEPGSSIAGTFLESGSFDTFGQLANYIGLQADAAAGALAVGVVELPFQSFAFEAHAAFFHEAIAAQAGVLVTRIAVDDGHRLDSSVIDTHEPAELYGLRSTGQGFALVGRVRSEIRPDGGGWDAFFARIASDGVVAAYRVIDIDRGDALFDAAMLANGGYLALGTTGYVQNPGGASISEDTQPLLVELDAAGSVVRRINVPDGPRQDQLRTIIPFGERWLLGGMLDGPGTHSGDLDRALITADGFLRDMPGLPR